MSRRAARVRAGLLAGALPGLALLAACTSPTSEPAPRAAVEVVLGGGTGPRLLAGPVGAVVEPGDVVRLRSRHEGEQASSVTHLLTSAPPGSAPPVFSRVARGALPNGAVWGACLGGRATASTSTCPVPPLQAPARWDGQDYVSVGALLGGESRELRLSDRLADGTRLRLWCSLHPTLQVTLAVGGTSSPATTPDPTPSRAPRPGEVLVAPDLPDAPGESLAFAPSTLRVRAGDVVTWRTTRPSPHSVELGAAPELGDTQPADSVPVVPAAGYPGGTARSGFLSTDRGAPGGTVFRLRFPRAGRYDYACRFHPTMRGSVVVV